jgi:protein-tyrosine phosphatase
MAEALFRHKVREAHLSDLFHIDSAGTGNWHVGEPAHAGTRAELARYGIDASGLVARQLTIGDLVQFDWIVTMDDSNAQGVRFLGKPTGTLAPMLSFGEPSGLTEVPDPWYTGDYAQTFQLLNAACDGLLQEILASSPANKLP